MPKKSAKPDPENSEQLEQSEQPAQMEQDEQGSIWIRGLYMLLFAVIAHIAELVIGLVMLVQFILKAFTENTNHNLLSFGNQLGKYVLEIVQFLTFNTEEKPFPFNTWPKADVEASASGGD